MDLRTIFKSGLTVKSYEKLLDDDQQSLHRLYARRARIDASMVDAARSARVKNVLVITEPWCGDSLAIFPVVAKLFIEAGCEIRVVRRDEHPDLIDQFLTNGGRAIPIVIVLDDQYRERFHWGPRPKPAQDIVMGHKAAVAAGTVDKSEVHKMVRAFYALDHGRSIVEELVAELTD